MAKLHAYSSTDRNKEAGIIDSDSPDSQQEDKSNDVNDRNATRSEVVNSESGISVEELIYGASSFHAIVKPVSITMLISSLVVIYINTDETKAQGEEALSRSYQVFAVTDDQTTATSLGLSLLNSLIIVCVITAMTFFIVLLYKFRCMKILIGYMVLATTVLLMFLGGNLFTVAINKYHLSIDRISYWVTMFNFAIVGTFAVFYQKGVPTIINQGYLIANSTIVAWQLSYFNDWMAWTLLIMLALYDLFAVLTPCGPLKALVNLMSKEDAPSMPGLLYEAELPENASRPKDRRNERTGNGVTSNDSRNNSVENNASILVRSGEQSTNRDEENDAELINFTDDPRDATNSTAAMLPYPAEIADASKTLKKGKSNIRDSDAISDASSRCIIDDALRPTIVVESDASSLLTLPLAIAKLYKLPLSPHCLGNNRLIDVTHPTAYLTQQLSAKQLQTLVQVTFPQGGGRIEKTQNHKGEPRYKVFNRFGDVKRTLLVDKNGKVMEVMLREDHDEDAKGRNTIKLGLGDFIFYSVLVSKAAENGFSAFVACFLSVLTGLGGTLVLLAVYHRALPALPMSIFLAVLFFVLTINCIEPWIEDMLQIPFYV